MREHLVVPPIRSREVACAQRSRVGHREDALQSLDIGDSLLGVHPSQCLTERRGGQSGAASLKTLTARSDGIMYSPTRQAMKYRRIVPVLMLIGSAIVLALITAGCGEQRKVDLSAERGNVG